MRFDDTYMSRENRYWLGIESESGRHYASIPVANGMIDYVEYYWISTNQYEEFMTDPKLAIEFVEACRRREHDDLLVHKPGTNRGIPV
ncbi:MAG: hypothetical protein JWQ86_4510 [Mycobacterium sp.]|jgi:hypothetical protein|nr:hypothetical protein [Mycobacterium sp.]MDT5387497.1 hypothetical protein [Mycobacterium sp.]